MSEDNYLHPFVMAAALVSFIVSVSIIGAYIVGAHNPEPFSLLPGSTIPFGMAAGLYVVGRRNQRSSSVSRAYGAAIGGAALTPPKPPKKESDSKYCKDCGLPFTMRQKQQGFDPQTGKPRLSFELGCPDGDPSQTSPEYQSYGRYPMAGPFTGDVYLWPNCGNTKYVPLTPVGHNHSQPDTKTDCPKCIDEMLSSGIIDLPDARKLMSSIR